MWVFRRSLVASVGLVLATFGQHSTSAVIINTVESGGGVQLIASGTIDLTGLTNLSLGSAYQQVLPNQGYLVTGPFAGSGVADIYTGLVGPTTFGTGGQTLASSATGTRLGIVFYGQRLYVTNGFGGGAVSSTTTFAGHTIASLGMTPGTYTWSWSHDSVTLVVPGGPVPIPGAMWLFASALAGLVVARRGRA